MALNRSIVISLLRSLVMVANEAKDLDDNKVRDNTLNSVADLAQNLSNKLVESIRSDASSSLDDYEKNLIRANRKIEAIKLLRGRTGLGLKEAKDVCDEWAYANGVPRPTYY